MRNKVCKLFPSFLNPREVVTGVNTRGLGGRNQSRGAMYVNNAWHKDGDWMRKAHGSSGKAAQLLSRQRRVLRG